VVIVDNRENHRRPAAVAVFCRQHQTARLAVVVRALEPVFLRDAMRAGVTECIPEPISSQVLDEALRRMLADGPADSSGQLIAFVGAKGGVGTTTLAVNTAAALAKNSKEDVLLIDLNIGLGDTSLLLGVEPRFSVADALENVHKVDASFFEGIVEKAASGVHLLGSGADNLRTFVDEARLRTLLEAVTRAYPVTVLDVSRSDAGLLNALDLATKLAVVTTHDLASLRQGGRLVDRLRQRYGGTRVSVILNRTDRSSTIADADVERAVGGHVEHRLPSDYRTATEALNAGRPFVLESQKGLASACRTLALDLAGVVKERKERPPSVLTRFVLRRT
jgi:pilus assembly protein CpaE